MRVLKCIYKNTGAKGNQNMRQYKKALTSVNKSLRRSLSLRTLVMTLAVLVVFVTTYLLVMPAFTLGREEALSQGGIDVPAVAEETEAESDADKDGSAASTGSETGSAGESDGKESSTSSQVELKYEADDYTVRVSGSNAGLAEDMTVKVDEIEESDKDKQQEYKQLYEDTLKAIQETQDGESVSGLSFARFYDISIMDGGKAVDPDSEVGVTITFEKALQKALSKDAGAIDPASVRIVHFAENEKTGEITPEVLDVRDVDITVKNDRMTEAAFASDSFSVFAVAGTTIEKNVLASDGHNYKVRVTYGDDAGVPDGAGLEVAEILQSEEPADGASEYETYLEKTREALGAESGAFGYARFFDIKIVDENGDKVEITAPVDVKIELADKENGKEDNTQVVHFPDEKESGEVVDVTTEAAEEGQTVSFEAEGFSVYGIVELDPADTAADISDLDGNSFYMSVDNGNNRYYYTNDLNSVPRIVKTTTIDAAARFTFESADADEYGNSFYIYTYDDDGNKKYVNMSIASNKGQFSFDDEALTKYTVNIYTEETDEASATFHIYHCTALKNGSPDVYYTWHYNTDFEAARKSKGNNDKIILTKADDGSSNANRDPYGLDGQSLGILWNNNDVSGSGMMAKTGTASVTVTLTDDDGNILKDENNKNITVKETISVLKNQTATVRTDPVSRTDRVFVANNTDITMWKFTCCGPAQYYITAEVGGELKYVRFDDTENHGNSDKGISLVDTPDDRCKITVTEGTGTYSGKYKFSCSGRALYNNNGNFFTVADTQNGANVWMYFADKSNLNDDDFVVYTAKKVSVSGPVNEDGTIDYDVKDGDQVVLYTRIWNEKTLEYEYFAIDYDGMLVKAYMSGDNISWVGSKVNTMLWDFTEYHYLDDDGNETDTPNYYYDLKNNYSGKYIAPQVSGTDFLSDSPIGINMNGRRYNEYYSTILAWDNPYYDYAMLMVPKDEYKLGSAPISAANDTDITRDFYFAIMTDVETPGEVSTVETIDHNSFGIQVKMINYPGGMQSDANGNYQNMLQTTILGKTSKTGSVVYPDLLKKNLSENGYPDVALDGSTHNLSELYADCHDLEGNKVEETTVNHTFLASTYSETGYFEYDCTQNFAHLITSTDDIWYGKPMPGGGTYDVGDFVVYDQLGTTSETGDTRRHGQFFPYNDLADNVEVDKDGNISITPKYNYSKSMSNTTDIKGRAITSLDPRYGEPLYEITNNKTNKIAPYVDHYFGMEMDANFMQTESGLDDWGHDLIFEFSGDDDFWLYIDGKLVLDLGGIHSACDGSINFRTGQVIVNGTKTNLRAMYRAAYLEEHPGASEEELNEYLDGFFKDGGTVFKDFSGHTMKMFYMERGAGASNLHMRFNLAPYVNGEVQLEKEVSGTDNITAAFPFQIFYEDKTSAEMVKAGRGTVYDPQVEDTATGDPIPYKDTYTVNGVTYDKVYMIKPGQTASISLPSEDIDYYFVECGIDTTVYDKVRADGRILTGTPAAGADDSTIKDFKITESTVAGRKKVVYNNHVSDSALKSLTVTKRLWQDLEKTREISSGDSDDADNTEFRFRIYIGEGTDKTVDGTGYAVYNTGKYYVKNSAGEYCIWSNGGFKSTGKTDFSQLSTVRPFGEWKSEAEHATFYTSPGGMADNIKAGYSIEIPGLMAGSPYYIEERADETQSGYDLIGYTTTEGAYSAENPGEEVNSGTILSNDTNRTVSVHNRHGYGLVVNKVWSDAAFMASHDDIYFAVYLKGSDGSKALLEDSVRRMHHPDTSIRWFFPELEEGRTLNDYLVYEVELRVPEGSSIAKDENEDPKIEISDSGAVTKYTTEDDRGTETEHTVSDKNIIKKQKDDSINVGGESNEHGYSVTYSYVVGYERQELSEDDLANKVNSRTDTVTNSRPGLKLVKTDLNGNPLGGAKFVLTDGDKVTKTFTSADDGLIAVAYLESGKEYTLKEKSAPYGYLTLIDSITIKKIVEDGNTKIYVNGAASDGEVKDEDDTVLYTVTQVGEPTADDMPVISIRNKGYALRAVKVDTYTNEPMKGVEFKLYKEVYESVEGQTDYNYPMPDYRPMEWGGKSSLITDEDGIIPRIVMKNDDSPAGLTAGTYYLRETTPSGYNSLGMDIRITISETGEVTLGSAVAPVNSGHWTMGNVSDEIASVAYDKDTGIMQITVKNTPKDPVRIKKLEMGTEDKILQNVGFELYKVSQVGDDGLPKTGEEPVVSGKTDAGGLLLLGGLEENTQYYLYETETLPGYNTLAAPVVITTTGSANVSAQLKTDPPVPLDCDKVKDVNENDVWEIKVYNSTGVELPHTGGIGTHIFTILGGILMIASGVSLILRRRKTVHKAGNSR